MVKQIKRNEIENGVMPVFAAKLAVHEVRALSSSVQQTHCCAIE